MLKRLILAWLLLMWPLFQFMPANYPLAAPVPQVMFFGQNFLSGISLVASSATVQGVNGGTSAAINTTGATFLTILVCHYGATAVTVASSPANTWSHGTETSHGNYKAVIYYSANATVGSSQTFSVAGTGVAATFAAIAFQGVSTSSPLDQESLSNTAVAPTIQPGTITPTQNNELVIVAMAGDLPTTGSYAINGGYSIFGSGLFINGTAVGGAGAYLIQTAKAATNPTYTITGSGGNMSAVIDSFKSK